MPITCSEVRYSHKAAHVVVPKQLSIGYIRCKCCDCTLSTTCYEDRLNFYEKHKDCDTKEN